MNFNGYIYRSLRDIYEEDNTIFDLLSLPTGYDTSIFKDVLLQDYGDRLSVYGVEEIKSAILIWSHKWQDSLKRIYEALTEEYNPLHNFDRHEVYTDIEDRESTIESEQNGTTESTSSGQTENTISADNESTYSPDNKSVSGASDSTDINNIVNTTDNLDRSLEHTGHLYGNIGVTKSQDMLNDEINIRERYSLYIPACELYANDMLLNLSIE